MGERPRARHASLPSRPLARAAPSCSWFVCGFADNERLVVQSQGSGGLSELLAQLKDDEVQFAGFRVTAVDRKGAVVR